MVLNAVSQQGETAPQLISGLCVLFESRLCFVKVLQRLFQLHILCTEQGTLLREETAVTGLITGFLRAYGAPFLPVFFKKTLAPLDDLKKASTLASPVGQIWLFRRFVDTIYTTADSMTLPVLRLLHLLTQTLSITRECSLESAFSDIVRSVYLLRFLCPFLVNRSFALQIKNTDAATNEQIRRGYLVSVKMLQCLASQTELGSQVKDREVLNAAILSSAEKYNCGIHMALGLAQQLSPNSRLSAPDTKSKSAGVSHKHLVDLASSTVAFLSSETFLSLDEVPPTFHLLCAQMATISSSRFSKELRFDVDSLI